MALSESVNESLNEAEASLRNALSYAARQERAFVCSTIANVITQIESIKSADQFMDTLDKMGKNSSSNFNF